MWLIAGVTGSPLSAPRAMCEKLDQPDGHDSNGDDRDEAEHSKQSLCGASSRAASVTPTEGNRRLNIWMQALMNRTRMGRLFELGPVLDR